MSSSKVFVEQQCAVGVSDYVEEFGKRVRLQVCGSIQGHDKPRFNEEIGNCMAVSQCRDVFLLGFEAACKTASLAFFGGVPFVDMCTQDGPWTVKASTRLSGLKS